jgi:hypothetical protein
MYKFVHDNIKREELQTECECMCVCVCSSSMLKKIFGSESGLDKLHNS